MRRLCMLLVIALLVLVLVPGISNAAQPVFRDLCWEDPPEKLGESTVIYDERLESPGIEFRIKLNENLQLGPLTANMIAYGFFKNRLIMVAVVANDARMLSEIAKAKYGLPQKSNPFIIDEFYVRGDTVCTVKEDFTFDGGCMLIASAAMIAEYDCWQKEQAKEASKAF